MTYDLSVPFALKKEQQWFGSIIGRPIDEADRIAPVSPTGNLIEIEASEHIAPSPTLRPAQRIEIYNQQYWWRLLKTFQETFPFLSRLFGYFEFNRLISIPYFVKYPPNHWSFGSLGDRLVQWVLEEYVGEDQQLVADAAWLDWAFVNCFTAGQLPAIIQNEGEDISTCILYTQPHVHLFNFDYELFKYRDDFLQQNHDYWQVNPFPELKRDKKYYFILYRNPELDISWKEIGKTEYDLLVQFKHGTSIENVCEWLETQSIDVYEQAANHLQEWFQEWTARNWLTPGS